jgi:hypothetical protein
VSSWPAGQSQRSGIVEVFGPPPARRLRYLPTRGSNCSASDHLTLTICASPTLHDASIHDTRSWSESATRSCSACATLAYYLPKSPHLSWLEKTNRG